MTKRNLAIGLSFFTTFGVLVHWTLVFTKIFPVVDLIPGYSDWFMAFPLADLWIAATAFLAVPFGNASGSALTLYGNGRSTHPILFPL